MYLADRLIGGGPFVHANEGIGAANHVKVQIEGHSGNIACNCVTSKTKKIAYDVTTSAYHF